MQEETLEVESNIGAPEKLRDKSQHKKGEERNTRELGTAS